MLAVIKDNRVHFFAFFVMSCCTSSASNDRLSALACEQREHGGVPCAGGACPAPGGTPTFLSLSPLAALKRRAKLTGRLPHGKLCKPVDHCYGISHIWEEALPWTDSRSKRTEPQYDWRNIGEPHWRSEFRSLNRCGFLRTKRACECGDWSVDNCRRCESPSCVEKLSIGCADSCCGATDCPQDCCAECNAWDLQCEDCKKKDGTCTPPTGECGCLPFDIGCKIGCWWDKNKNYVYIIGGIIGLGILLWLLRPLFGIAKNITET